MQLVASGCSFTENVLVEDPWPNRLANKLGAKLTNLGSGGRGNEYIFNMAFDNLEKADLMVVQWSSFDRWDFCNNTFEIPYLLADGGTMPRKNQLIDDTNIDRPIERVSYSRVSKHKRVYLKTNNKNE